MRTACVIAVAKARELLEPLVHQLGYRLAHVLRRMLPISMYLLQVRTAGVCVWGGLRGLELGMWGSPRGLGAWRVWEGGWRWKREVEILG